LKLEAKTYNSNVYKNMLLSERRGPRKVERRRERCGIWGEALTCALNPTKEFVPVADPTGAKG